MPRTLPLLVAVVAAMSAWAADKPDASVLMKADEQLATATAARGVEGFQSFLAEDVTTLRPNAPVFQGRQALADLWRPLLSDPEMSITWKPLLASISEAGDFGFTVGSYEITRTSTEGRKVTGTGKYVTIWKKQKDGCWKVVFDSGVQDAPPKPPL